MTFMIDLDAMKFMEFVTDLIVMVSMFASAFLDFTLFMVSSIIMNVVVFVDVTIISIIMDFVEFSMFTLFVIAMNDTDFMIVLFALHFLIVRTYAYFVEYTDALDVVDVDFYMFIYILY